VYKELYEAELENLENLRKHLAVSVKPKAVFFTKQMGPNEVELLPFTSIKNLKLLAISAV
jgi:hypothetical protein